MDTVDYRERIQDVLAHALKSEFGTELGLSNGSLPSSVADLITQVAQIAARHEAQKAFDFYDDETVGPDDVAAVNPRNRLNELTGGQWLYFTKSIIRTSYPSILGHELRRAQGGNKPPQLMQELIEFFTKSDGLVLDPFAGSGGTALGAHLAGRKSMNIELNPQSIEIYKKVCALEKIKPHKVILGDCREILPTLKEDSFDFIATDPPYSPELEQTMSGDRPNAQYGRQNRKSSYIAYSDDPRDLSKTENFDTFFDEMTSIGQEMFRVLKPKKYLAMILRDAYQGGKYIPSSAIIAQRYGQIGWVLKGEKIWYQTGARIRPYGYPNAYIPNIIHQNILIFRKE